MPGIYTIGYVAGYPMYTLGYVAGYPMYTRRWEACLSVHP